MGVELTREGAEGAALLSIVNGTMLSEGARGWGVMGGGAIDTGGLSAGVTGLTAGRDRML